MGVSSRLDCGDARDAEGTGDVLWIGTGDHWSTNLLSKFVNEFLRYSRRVRDTRGNRDR